MSNANRKQVTNNTSLPRRQELIMRYYPMVRQIAAKMARKYPSHVDVNDLIQIGVLGLIEAIDRYKPDQYPTFSAYARIRIQGAILDDRRSQDWTPRSVRDRANLLTQAKAGLKNRLNRDSTAEELACYLEISADKLERMKKNAEIRTVMSMEHGDDESMRLGDVIPGKQRNPHEEMLCMEKKTMVLHQLKSLPEREERIVEMHYFKGVSFQLISKEFGVSEARISQIHSSIKSKLHRKLSPVLEA